MFNFLKPKPKPVDVAIAKKMQNNEAREIKDRYIRQNTQIFFEDLLVTLPKDQIETALVDALVSKFEPDELERLGNKIATTAHYASRTA